MSRGWQLSDIPDLAGKVAIVTGGNTGLGYRSSLELARNGAHVVIACRSLEKGEAATERIRGEVPGADLEVIQLDLVAADSIGSFAAEFLESHRRLDILMNNAGVVNAPEREVTADGYELQMATNHFGHFALTMRLAPSILATERSRVVTLTSGGQRFGETRLDDLDWSERDYSPVKAYSDSKLANLLFTLSLQERFANSGATAISVAAHPGLTGTERQQSVGVGGGLTKRLASPVAHGVLSQLRAATDAEVRGGDLWAPRFGIRGRPTKHNKIMAKLDREDASSLWAVSESATGVGYPG